MARMSNDSMAEVLAEIANLFIDEKNPLVALKGMQVRNIIVDFVESRPPNFGKVYDSKLNIPCECECCSKVKV